MEDAIFEATLDLKRPSCVVTTAFDAVPGCIRRCVQAAKAKAPGWRSERNLTVIICPVARNPGFKFSRPT